MREQYPSHSYYNNYNSQLPSYERDDYYMEYCNEAQEPTGSGQSHERNVDNRPGVYTGQPQEQAYFDYSSQFGDRNYPMENGQDSFNYVFIDSSEKDKENNTNGLVGNNFRHNHS